VQFLTTLEAKLEEVIERKKCSLMLGLKLLFWEISMYSGKILEASALQEYGSAKFRLNSMYTVMFRADFEYD